jgi:hypothetical protein
MLAGGKVMEKYSWEGQRALAEEMVAPWRYVLQKIGVKASVAVYAGSLSNVVETYCREDETSLVMRAQNNLSIRASSASIMGFLRRPIVERQR